MSDDLWSIKLPSGDVRCGTLDELDAAFEAGHIDEDVLVLAPNASSWVKLGELAGLGDEAPPEQAAVAASIPPSIPPYAAYAPYAASPNSLRPVMTDLDDLTFDAPPRRSKTGLFVGIGAAVAVVGAAIFGVTKLGSVPPDPPSVSAAAIVQPPAPPPATPPPPADPVADAPSAQAPQLTDAQKKALLDIDNKRQKSAKDRKKSRDEAAATAAASHHSTHQSGYGPPRKAGQGCSCKHGDPLCTCL